jgi:hypothetical protein
MGFRGVNVARWVEAPSALHACNGLPVLQLSIDSVPSVKTVAEVKWSWHSFAVHDDGLQK